MNRIMIEEPCPECRRFHIEPLLKPDGDPESSIAYCYTGGSRRVTEDAPRTNTRQFCARCQSVDRVGFFAPKHLWRLVAGPRWEHDILCLACFAEIGDEKGVEWDVPELEFYPVSYATLKANREVGGS